MQMKKSLIKGGLALMGLAITAMPALPSTLSFSFVTGNQGSYSLSGGQLAVGSFFNVSGWTGFGGATNDSLTATLFLESVSAGVDTFELYSSNTINGATSTQANPLLAFTAQTTVGGTNNTSLSFSSTFVGSLTALNTTFGAANGITSPSVVTIASGDGATLSGGSPTSGSPGTVSSAVLATTFTATPEPASFLLFGSGLVGAALFGRKRMARQASGR
jgi:hypothetical protein